MSSDHQGAGGKTPVKGVRLQKILAQAAVASRRKSEELIAAGRVTVNGTVAHLGDRADPQGDSIKVDGKRLRAPPELRYLLLNKPRGVLSTTDDPKRRPTVLDLIPSRLRSGLHPVGRLDYNTEGLLLLTNDGAFSQRVAHPRHGCSKTYEVKVRGVPPEPTLARLREGVLLEGRKTAPCRIVPRPGRRPAEGGNSWWIVTLSEGRTRQIREMFFRAGFPVQRLRRVAIGPLRDSRLSVGAYRTLSDDEVAFLLSGKKSRKTGSRKRAAIRGRRAPR